MAVAALNLIRMVSSLSIANVTIFRPSSFFIIVHTNVGLQLVIQLVPTMQLYIHVDPSFKGRTCGKKYFKAKRNLWHAWGAKYYKTGL